MIIGENGLESVSKQGRFEVCQAFERLGGNFHIVELSAEMSVDDWRDSYVLYFDAEAIRDSRMKETHEKAILYARESGVLIAFAPNLQMAHWKSEMAMKLAVEEFLPLVDIVKVSDEELEFVAGTTNVEEAADILLQGQTKLFIYTQGADDVMVFTRHSFAEADGFPADMVNTEGVEEKFFASFLYCIYRDRLTAEKIVKLDSEVLRRYLEESVRAVELE